MIVRRASRGDTMRYSTASVHTDRRVRVAVVGSHHALVEAARAVDGVDLQIVDPARATTDLPRLACDVVIDLSETACPAGGAVGDTLRSWFTRQRWTVGLLPFGIDEVLQRGTLPAPAWLAGQPADRFYADPFLIDAGPDAVRLLVEDYRYPSRAKGL